MMSFSIFFFICSSFFLMILPIKDLDAFPHFNIQHLFFGNELLLLTSY